MCGIYGRWNLTGTALELAAVSRATSTLRHRGPDDEGYFLGTVAARRYVHCRGSDSSIAVDLPHIEALRSESLDLAFGFRRLAVLDPTVCGHQPMSTPDGRFTIVYNGEVYNYRELRQELASMGYTFHGDSDTEVVLAAYAEWEVGCLHRFNGMWAFAIWDANNAQLVLARDRFGIKPLHYVSSPASFAFASEIKALVGSHGIEFRPDGRALYRYLESGDLPDPRTGDTFFEHVRALPPAHVLTLNRQGMEIRRYYEIPREVPPSAPAQQAVERYRELFEDAVRLYLRSDVAVGTCLSGGVDSSSIAAVVNRLLIDENAAAWPIGDRQKTFSAVYDSDGPYNERQYIEKVLGALRTEGHFVFPDAQRLHDELPRLVRHQEEPFGSTSIFAQWCVMAKAREQGVTVLLDGQGADEPLGGYRPYDIYTADLLRQGRCRQVLASSRHLRALGIPPARVLVRAVARQLPDAVLEPLRRARHARSRRALRHEFASAHGRNRQHPPASRNLHEHFRELIEQSSLPHLLRYEDRNSMAFSVEGRVPFLDHRLVEYALGEAFHWCIHNGWTKWPLREAMRGHVPTEVLWRRDKVGFETPERAWLQPWLLRAGESHFGPDARCAAYLDLAIVRQDIARYLEHGGDDRQVWRWINVEMWLRAFS